MISALLINLAREKERLQFQRRQLTALGIPFTRLEAVDAEQLDDSDYARYADNWQRKLRRSEVACYLSHHQAWEQAAAAAQATLILEDDALLSERLPAFLTALTQTPADFDHISLETRARKKRLGKHPVATPAGIALHPLFLDKSGAAAYILTPHGAQKLLEHSRRHGAALADAVLCHHPDLKRLQTVPALALQNDTAAHYRLPVIGDTPSAISNRPRPPADNLNDALRYKIRRLRAQWQNLAAILRHPVAGKEIFPDPGHFAHLQPPAQENSDKHA